MFNIYVVSSFVISVVFYCQSTYTLHSYSDFELDWTTASQQDDKENFYIYDNHSLCEDCKNISKFTKVYSFSRNSDDYKEIEFRNLSSFADSYFDKNKTTKILIHGWRGAAFATFETELRKSYQSQQDVNLLAVDWSVYARQLYALARQAVIPVGKFLALFLDWLILEAGVSVGTIHIIGHSLGAQIAGVIGEHLTEGKIGRISGLDPAGPEFTTSTSGRLDSSDAQFVDVIHTCGHWAGYFPPCGHVDFYPNKGEPPQPGCTVPILTCSHLRSYAFFNESISSQSFVATACDSWEDYKEGYCVLNSTVVMGEHVDTSARGKFYLTTSDRYPYALGNITTLNKVH